MTFSMKVKEELAEICGDVRHCLIAELAGLCAFARRKGQGYGGYYLEWDSSAAAKKVFTLIKKAYNITVCLYADSENPAKEAKRVVFEDSGSYLKIEKSLNHSQVLSLECCKRAFVRGAFIAAGTIVDPSRYYRLEFVHADEHAAERLAHTLEKLGIETKQTKRRDICVVYLNNGEQISWLLGLMDGTRALLEFENERVLHHVRGTVQRKVNCETSNINKTIRAAQKQINDIDYIEDTVGLASLPEQLRKTAMLRKENPDASITELGNMMKPGVTRSGMNHRLRKLSAIASELRGE